MPRISPFARFFPVLIGAVTSGAVPVAAAPITLAHTFQIPSETSDGLLVTPAVLEDGTPHDRMAAFGSALTYTGASNLYLATPDRGPADGTTSYRDRAYLLRLPFPPAPPSCAASTTFVQAMLLRNELEEGFTGNAATFDPTGSPASLRLDPEGVRVGPRGTFFVSDEYGPYVYEFDGTGRRIRSLQVPDKFLVTTPRPVGVEELPPTNVKGRQANRGMEGLAISPDGGKLFGIMQNALIQDGALNSSNSRRGVHNRILEIDVATGATREFVYVLDSRSNGCNDMVAVNDHQLLVIERDGSLGVGAVTKKIFLIDIAGATDVSAIPSLPQTAPLPVGVTPVAKSLFLDLLDPAFGLAGASFPEKVEALAFGNHLADGRLVLQVATDNDFLAGQPTVIWSFAIDPGALPGYSRQMLSPRLSLPRRIHVGGGGEVKVTVHGNSLLGACEIDPASLLFAGARVQVKGRNRLDCKLKDDDHDGIDDLECSFERRSLLLTRSDRTATLTGATTTGTPLRSSGAVEVR